MGRRPDMAALPPGYYRLGVWYRLEAELGAGFGLVLHDHSGGPGHSSRLDPREDGWRRFETTFRLASSADWRVLLYLKGKGRLWYDDAHLVAISKEEYMAANRLVPRDYHIDTALVADVAPQCLIVSSARRPAYTEIARSLQEAMRERSGIEVPIVDAEEVTTDEVLAGKHAIALGNLVTSRFIARLYWEWYTLLDVWYPGPGGHVLRTLHDPYGLGHNVILVGGSDDEGVRAAAEALVRVLPDRRDLAVGRLMEIKLGRGHEMPPEGEWVDLRLRIFRTDLGLPMSGRAIYVRSASTWTAR